MPHSSKRSIVTVFYSAFVAFVALDMTPLALFSPFTPRLYAADHTIQSQPQTFEAQEKILLATDVFSHEPFDAKTYDPANNSLLPVRFQNDVLAASSQPAYVYNGSNNGFGLSYLRSVGLCRHFSHGLIFIRCCTTSAPEPGDFFRPHSSCLHYLHLADIPITCVLWLTKLGEESFAKTI